MGANTAHDPVLRASSVWDFRFPVRSTVESTMVVPLVVIPRLLPAIGTRSPNAAALWIAKAYDDDSADFIAGIMNVRRTSMLKSIIHRNKTRKPKYQRAVNSFTTKTQRLTLWDLKWGQGGQVRFSPRLFVSVHLRNCVAAEDEQEYVSSPNRINVLQNLNL